LCMVSKSRRSSAWVAKFPVVCGQLAFEASRFAFKTFIQVGKQHVDFLSALPSANLKYIATLATRQVFGCMEMLSVIWQLFVVMQGIDAGRESQIAFAQSSSEIKRHCF
ncbi:MAG: hypothetical protein R6V55_09660, partial [Desulfovermiculus sp.]